MNKIINMSECYFDDMLKKEKNLIKRSARFFLLILNIMHYTSLLVDIILILNVMISTFSFKIRLNTKVAEGM